MATIMITMCARSAQSSASLVMQTKHARPAIQPREVSINTITILVATQPAPILSMATHPSSARGAIATVSHAIILQPIAPLADRAAIILCSTRISARPSAKMAGFLSAISAHSARHHVELAYLRLILVQAAQRDIYWVRSAMILVPQDIRQAHRNALVAIPSATNVHP